MNRPEPPMFAPGGYVMESGPRGGYVTVAPTAAPLPVAQSDFECRAAKLAFAGAAALDGLAFAGGLGVFVRVAKTGKLLYAARQGAVTTLARAHGVGVGKAGNLSRVPIGGESYVSTLSNAGRISRNNILSSTTTVYGGVASGNGVSILDIAASLVPGWNTYNAYQGVKKACQ